MRHRFFVEASGSRGCREMARRAGLSRAKCCALAWVALLTTSACNDCDTVVEEAKAFIQDTANRACRQDDDCVVVGVSCLDIPSYCGQTAISTSASNSTAWQDLASQLSDCGDQCSTCGAALLPNCDNGLCVQPAIQ